MEFIDYFENVYYILIYDTMSRGLLRAERPNPSIPRASRRRAHIKNTSVAYFRRFSQTAGRFETCPYNHLRMAKCCFLFLQLKMKYQLPNKNINTLYLQSETCKFKHGEYKKNNSNVGGRDVRFVHIYG
jgi:hypothetical protein